MKRTGIVALISAGIFALSAAVFLRLGSVEGSDIQLHLGFLSKAYGSNLLLLGNFLFYTVIAALTGFSNDHRILFIVTVVVLALSVCAKFLLSMAIVRTLLPEENHAFKRYSGLIVLLSSISLLVVHCVPVTKPTWRMYLGYIPPSVWHNSTTIFLMPLALLLFRYSLRYLERPSRLLLALTGFLLLLNIAAKPSYAFVFLVAFPLVGLIRFGLSRRFLGVLSVCIVGVAAIGLQYHVIFTMAPIYSGGGGFALRLFGGWRILTVVPPWPHVTSLLFPLLILICYHARIRVNLPYLYAATGFIVAYGISLLVTETGPREGDGNFVWQAIVSNYLLFMVSLVIFIQEIQSKPNPSAADRIIAGAYGLHVVSGVGYLVKILATGNYY